MNCFCCRFYPRRVCDFIFDFDYSGTSWRTILRLRQNRNIMLVNLIAGVLLVFGLGISTFLILHGSTPLFLISWIPYVFIFGIIMVFGYPVPFSPPDSIGNGFVIYDTDEMCKDDLKHFSICCFAPAPVFLSLIFSMISSSSILAVVFFITAHLSMLSSMLFLFIVYCTQPPEDIQEEFEMIEEGEGQQ